MKLPAKHTILAVDDNEDSLYALERILKHHGYNVVCAKDGDEAIDRAKSEAPDLVLLDVMMPGKDGFQVTKQFRADETLRFVPVVLVTARDSLDDIISGLESGADDYLTKPFRPEELLARIRAALRTRALYQNLQRSEERADNLLSQLAERHDHRSIVGESAVMKQVLSLVEKVAGADSPVLITGPTGSGKELIARAIHFGSKRFNAPFVAQNCAAFSETLLESELFGYVRGAFTGALRDKRGLFEAADGGTLFLDEVGEMPLSLQAKFLRVLQEQRFIPVGGTQEKSVDVRIVAATNRDLKAMVDKGTFREDLYYRLNVIAVALPPLSKRRDDIPLLVESILEKAQRRFGGGKKRLTKAAMEVLQQASWRGNIRELENELERMIILGRDVDELDVDLISPHILNGCDGDGETATVVGAGGGTNLRDTLRRTEETLIREALSRCGGNKSVAAKELGISRSNLIAKAKMFGLDRGGDDEA